MFACINMVSLICKCCLWEQSEYYESVTNLDSLLVFKARILYTYCIQYTVYIQNSFCIDDTSNDGDDNGERLYESVRMEEED